MKVLYAFAQFLISEWIWSVTHAIHHALINIVLLALLLMKVARQRMVTAVLSAVGSQLWAICSFALIVHLLLDKLLGIFPEQTQTILHPLAACFLLGAIYTVLQTLFFYLMGLIWPLPFERYARIVFWSNSITALVTYMLFVRA